MRRCSGPGWRCSGRCWRCRDWKRRRRSWLTSGVGVDPARAGGKAGEQAPLGLAGPRGVLVAVAALAVRRLVGALARALLLETELQVDRARADSELPECRLELGHVARE